MKRYLGLIVVVVGVIAGMWYAFKKWDAKTAETQDKRSWIFIERLSGRRISISIRITGRKTFGM